MMPVTFNDASGGIQLEWMRDTRHRRIQNHDNHHKHGMEKAPGGGDRAREPERGRQPEGGRGEERKEMRERRDRRRRALVSLGGSPGKAGKAAGPSLPPLTHGESYRDLKETGERHTSHRIYTHKGTTRPETHLHPLIHPPTHPPRPYRVVNVYSHPKTA